MKKLIIPIILLLLLLSCHQETKDSNQNVVTADIAIFWEAYDKIISTQDSIMQLKYLDSLYFKKATPGLEGIRRARNYTAQEYLSAINNYPKFWNSIRKNTGEVERIRSELEEGIGKLKELYPELKPAKIYFTMGAFRTGGTTIDSLILIGSEISLADSLTVTSEFPESLSHLKSHFATNPKNHLVFLNVHEYVHTQQNPRVFNILSLALYEGVAEFVAVKALGIPSPNPQIGFGKTNSDRIREVFEREMFYVNNLYKWLDGNAPNEFGMRDLGYYIGYQICELYYNQVQDKRKAIKDLIELDYNNESEIEDLVNGTGFFSASLEQLYEDFQKKRPTVVGLTPFQNKSENVSPTVKEITILFSEPLNGHNTGIDYGPLGEEYFPPINRHRVWAEDAKSWTLKIDLAPNKHYQFLISNNFRKENGIPLQPFVVEFKTGNN